MRERRQSIKYRNNCRVALFHGAPRWMNAQIDGNFVSHYERQKKQQGNTGS